MGRCIGFCPSLDRPFLEPGEYKCLVNPYTAYAFGFGVGCRGGNTVCQYTEIAPAIALSASPLTLSL